MIILVGIICFFSNQGCTGGEQHRPQMIGEPFATMEDCRAFKTKIDEKVAPTEWMDTKSECMEIRETQPSPGSSSGRGRRLDLPHDSTSSRSL